MGNNDDPEVITECKDSKLTCIQFVDTSLFLHYLFSFKVVFQEILDPIRKGSLHLQL